MTRLSVPAQREMLLSAIDLSKIIKDSLLVYCLNFKIQDFVSKLQI